MSTDDATAPVRTGRSVFAGLAVATAVEFIVALSRLPGAPLLILAIAAVKALLIVVYFMHIGELRGEAE